MMTVYRLVLLEVDIKYDIINQKNVMKNRAYLKCSGGDEIWKRLRDAIRFCW